MAKKKNSEDWSLEDAIFLNQLSKPEPPISLDDLLLMDELLRVDDKPLEVPEFDPVFLSEVLDKIELDPQAAFEAAGNTDWLDYLFDGVPEGATEPLAETDPSLSDLDAARWMMAEVNKRILHHGTVVNHLWRHFGQRFTRRNKAGNRVIATSVLYEFLKLTEDTVVWSRKEQFWRKRQSTDPSGRMVE